MRLAALLILFGHCANCGRTHNNTVKIKDFHVPEVIQTGNAKGAVLDCQYWVGGDNFSVSLNHSTGPVFAWSSGMPPRISGILNGRANLPSSPSASQTVIFVTDVSPDLIGDYTCEVVSGSAVANQTKTMVVFSPEHEFELKLEKHNNAVSVVCLARGLYPQPELIIESDGVAMPQQEVRVWREGTEFAARGAARAQPPGRAACRLTLPQAGYTAIKELAYSTSAASVAGYRRAVYQLTTTPLPVIMYIITHLF